MASIAENLRATLLSLKQISDRVKHLILTYVTKTELSTAKQEVIDALKDIDIDTTDLAKQGTNAEATLTAIYEALKGSEEPSQDIPEGVAERLALILEFFGIKTLDGYEFMTEQEIYDELEVIMTTMDGDLTAEMAASITEETISLVET